MDSTHKRPTRRWNGLIRASPQESASRDGDDARDPVLGVLQLPLDSDRYLADLQNARGSGPDILSGMPAERVEKDITNRLERWTGQAAEDEPTGVVLIVGASVVRNY